MIDSVFPSPISLRNNHRDHSDNAVRLKRPPRSLTKLMLTIIHFMTARPVIDHYHLRKPINWTLHWGATIVYSVSTAAKRQFNAVTTSHRLARRLSTTQQENFDLTLDEDQCALRNTAKNFALQYLRPFGKTNSNNLDDLIEQANQLGLNTINIPEDFNGIATERNTVTNVVIAEALSYGDMGLAALLLAPVGVVNVLTHWASASQQEAYLPEFTSSTPPQACIAVSEPHALFDPFHLHTTAIRIPGGYLLNGVKSFIPIPSNTELFLVAAMYDGQPEFFIVESGCPGTKTCMDPSMGLKSAQLGQLLLEDTRVPLTARLAEGQFTLDDYASIISLARLGWAGLAIGTCQAVLDYVVPYVKQRHAFGEPIAHRQSVAFMCADIAIELDGLRLLTWRGASRAQQGLPYHREAGLAKITASRRGMQIGSSGVQLLGGHGYVTEHPVEQWYRDLRSIGVAEGLLVI